MLQERGREKIRAMELRDPFSTVAGERASEFVLKAGRGGCAEGGGEGSHTFITVINK